MARDLHHYIRISSPREIFLLSFRMYVSNFWSLYLIAAVTLLPLAIVSFMISSDELSILIRVFAFLLGGSAVIVAASDICVGNRPTLRRAYARIFGIRLWKLLATLVLLMLVLILLVGMLALLSFFGSIVGESSPFPIVLYMLLWLAALGFCVGLLARFIFANTVVLLEDKWWLGALRRSMVLSRGHAARNLALLAGFLLIRLLAEFFPSVYFETEFIDILFGTALTPLIYIIIVLLYYDLRSRKESKDYEDVPEDLIH